MRMAEAIVGVLLQEMGPEDFMRDFGGDWRISFQELPHRDPVWVDMHIARGFEHESHHRINRQAAEWWAKFVPWLDEKWPFESYYHALGTHPSPSNWINAAWNRGFKQRFEEITGNKFPRVWSPYSP